MSDKGLGMFALTEVRDGKADTTVAEGIAHMYLDWDNVGDDWHYASGKLDELDDLVGDLPDEDVNRIREAIIATWPAEAADRVGKDLMTNPQPDLGAQLNANVAALGNAITAQRTDVEPEFNGITDEEAMNAIHAVMTGVEWDSDTLDAIADIVHRTARTIEEPESHA